MKIPTALMNTDAFESFAHCACIFFIGKVTDEHEVDGTTPVENHEDNESVKDLGETADLLNLVSTKRNIVP